MTRRNTVPKQHLMFRQQQEILRVSRVYLRASKREDANKDQSLPLGQLEGPYNGNWKDQDHKIREDIERRTSHVISVSIDTFPSLVLVPKI